MKTPQNRSPEASSKNDDSISCRRQTLAGKICCYAGSLLLLVLLISCGGGDIIASGGIGGTGSISIGTISALGSIFVNGVEFDTSGASVDYNGSSGNPSLLQVGMVVTVEGTINQDGRTGVAKSVVYDNNLLGPISSIDQANGSITVLGQHIFTDGQTVFAAGTAVSSQAELHEGDIIEVSGLTNADGSIEASRITLLAAASVQEYQITGQVSNVTAGTFQINDLTIDYAQAGQGMGRMSSPQDGQVVQAVGMLNSNNILVATAMRKMGDYSGKKGQMLLSGFIRSAAADTFTISAPMGSLMVDVGQDTVFTGGTAADLVPGVLVQVKGGMSMGTVTAREISISN